MTFRKTKKIISAFLLLSFLCTDIVQAAPPLSVRGGAESNLPSFSLTLPSELGGVEEVYFPRQKLSSKKTLFVLHIQTVHGHYETALRIKEIIRYFQKEYGANTLFAEGASGVLYPEHLNFLSNDKHNVQVLDALARKGELTGVDLALAPQNLLSQKALKGFGIEDPQVYREAYQSLKKVLNSLDQSASYLEKQRMKIDKEASKILSRDLKELIDHWLKLQSKNPEFLRVLSFLRKQAEEVLELDFQNAFSQFQWPQLTRLILLQELEKRIKPKELAKEKEALSDWCNEQGIVNCISNLGARHTSPANASSRETTQWFLEQAIPKGFQLKSYPQVTYQNAYQVLESEMKAQEIFEELERLFAKLFEKQIKTEEQKEIVEQYKEFILLKKLLSLELTPEEWKRVNRGWGVGDGEWNEVVGMVNHAFRFYELMASREEAFLKNMKSKMISHSLPSTPYAPHRVAILVTGGFHTNGMKRLFREKEIGYAVITPKIESDIDSSIYHKIMTRTSHMEQTLLPTDQRIALQMDWNVLDQSNQIRSIIRDEGFRVDSTAPYFKSVQLALSETRMGVEEELVKKFEADLRAISLDEAGNLEQAVIEVDRVMDETQQKMQEVGATNLDFFVKQFADVKRRELQEENRERRSLLRMIEAVKVGGSKDLDSIETELREILAQSSKVFKKGSTSYNVIRNVVNNRFGLLDEMSKSYEWIIKIEAVGVDQAEEIKPVLKIVETILNQSQNLPEAFRERVKSLGEIKRKKLLEKERRRVEILLRELEETSFIEGDDLDEVENRIRERTQVLNAVIEAAEGRLADLSDKVMSTSEAKLKMIKALQEAAAQKKKMKELLARAQAVQFVEGAGLDSVEQELRSILKAAEGVFQAGSALLQSIKSAVEPRLRKLEQYRVLNALLARLEQIDSEQGANINAALRLIEDILKEGSSLPADLKKRLANLSAQKREELIQTERRYAESLLRELRAVSVGEHEADLEQVKTRLSETVQALNVAIQVAEGRLEDLKVKARNEREKKEGEIKAEEQRRKSEREAQKKESLLLRVEAINPLNLSETEALDSARDELMAISEEATKVFEAESPARADVLAAVNQRFNLIKQAKTFFELMGELEAVNADQVGGHKVAEVLNRITAILRLKDTLPEVLGAKLRALGTQKREALFVVERQHAEGLLRRLEGVDVLNEQSLIAASQDQVSQIVQELEIAIQALSGRLQDLSVEGARIQSKKLEEIQLERDRREEDYLLKIDFIQPRWVVDIQGTIFRLNQILGELEQGVLGDANDSRRVREAALIKISALELEDAVRVYPPPLIFMTEGEINRLRTADPFSFSVGNLELDSSFVRVSPPKKKLPCESDCEGRDGSDTNRQRSETRMIREGARSLLLDATKRDLAPSASETRTLENEMHPTIERVEIVRSKDQGPVKLRVFRRDGTQSTFVEMRDAFQGKNFIFQPESSVRDEFSVVIKLSKKIEGQSELLAKNLKKEKRISDVASERSLELGLQRPSMNRVKSGGYVLVEHSKFKPYLLEIKNPGGDYLEFNEGSIYLAGSEKVQVVIQVAQEILKIIKLGILAGDIKGSNVLFSRAHDFPGNVPVHLIDFGTYFDLKDLVKRQVKNKEDFYRPGTNGYTPLSEDAQLLISTLQQQIQLSEKFSEQDYLNYFGWITLHEFQKMVIADVFGDDEEVVSMEPSERVIFKGERVIENFLGEMGEYEKLFEVDSSLWTDIRDQVLLIRDSKETVEFNRYLEELGKRSGEPVVQERFQRMIHQLEDLKSLLEQAESVLASGSKRREEVPRSESRLRSTSFDGQARQRSASFGALPAGRQGQARQHFASFFQVLASRMESLDLIEGISMRIISLIKQILNSRLVIFSFISSSLLGIGRTTSVRISIFLSIASKSVPSWVGVKLLSLIKNLFLVNQLGLRTSLIATQKLSRRNFFESGDTRFMIAQGSEGAIKLGMQVLDVMLQNAYVALQKAYVILQNAYVMRQAAYMGLQITYAVFKAVHSLFQPIHFLNQRNLPFAKNTELILEVFQNNRPMTFVESGIRLFSSSFRHYITSWNKKIRLGVNKLARAWRDVNQFFHKNHINMQKNYNLSPEGQVAYPRFTGEPLALMPSWEGQSDRHPRSETRKLERFLTKQGLYPVEKLRERTLALAERPEEIAEQLIRTLKRRRNRGHVVYVGDFVRGYYSEKKELMAEENLQDLREWVVSDPHHAYARLFLEVMSDREIAKIDFKFRARRKFNEQVSQGAALLSQWSFGSVVGATTSVFQKTMPEVQFETVLGRNMLAEAAHSFFWYNGDLDFDKLPGSAKDIHKVLLSTAPYNWSQYLLNRGTQASRVRLKGGLSYTGEIIGRLNQDSEGASVWNSLLETLSDRISSAYRAVPEVEGVKPLKQRVIWFLEKSRKDEAQFFGEYQGVPQMMIRAIFIEWENFLRQREPNALLLEAFVQKLREDVSLQQRILVLAEKFATVNMINDLFPHIRAVFMKNTYHKLGMENYSPKLPSEIDLEKNINDMVFEKMGEALSFIFPDNALKAKPITEVMPLVGNPRSALYGHLFKELGPGVQKLIEEAMPDIQREREDLESRKNEKLEAYRNEKTRVEKEIEGVQNLIDRDMGQERGESLYWGTEDFIPLLNKRSDLDTKLKRLDSKIAQLEEEISSEKKQSKGLGFRPHFPLALLVGAGVVATGVAIRKTRPVTAASETREVEAVLVKVEAESSDALNPESLELLRHELVQRRRDEERFSLKARIIRSFSKFLADFEKNPEKYKRTDWAKVFGSLQEFKAGFHPAENMSVIPDFVRVAAKYPEAFEGTDWRSRLQFAYSEAGFAERSAEAILNTTVSFLELAVEHPEYFFKFAWERLYRAFIHKVIEGFVDGSLEITFAEIVEKSKLFFVVDPKLEEDIDPEFAEKKLIERVFRGGRLFTYSRPENLFLDSEKFIQTKILKLIQDIEEMLEEKPHLKEFVPVDFSSVLQEQLEFSRRNGIAAAIRQNPAVKVDLLVTEGGKVRVENSRERYELNPTSNMKALAEKMHPLVSFQKTGEVQVSIGFDTGGYAFTQDNGKFIALWLILANSSLEKYHLFKEVPLRDQRAAYGLLIRGEEVHPLFSGQEDGHRTDFVFRLPPNISLEELEQLLRNIQVLSLGMLLASEENVYYRDQIIVRPSWMDSRMQAIAARSRKFDRDFVSLLRRYNVFRNPKNIIKTKNHALHVEAIQRYRAEEALFHHYEWLTPLQPSHATSSMKRSWNELLQPLRSLEAVLLSETASDIEVSPGESLTVGAKLIKEVKELGEEAARDIEELLKRSLNTFPFLEVPHIEDPFINPGDEEATRYYLETFRGTLDQLPNPKLFMEAANFYKIDRSDLENKSETRQKSLASLPKRRVHPIKNDPGELPQEDDPIVVPSTVPTPSRSPPPAPAPQPSTPIEPPSEPDPFPQPATPAPREPAPVGLKTLVHSETRNAKAFERGKPGFAIFGNDDGYKYFVKMRDRLDFLLDRREAIFEKEFNALDFRATDTKLVVARKLELFAGRLTTRKFLESQVFVPGEKLESTFFEFNYAIKEGPFPAISLTQRYEPYFASAFSKITWELTTSDRTFLWDYLKDHPAFTAFNFQNQSAAQGETKSKVFFRPPPDLKPLRRMLKIAFDSYFHYQIRLLALRLWEGELTPEESRDELVRLQKKLQTGSDSDSQEFLRHASTHYLHMSSFFSEEERRYVEMTEEVSKLFENYAGDSGANVGRHLRYLMSTTGLFDQETTHWDEKKDLHRVRNSVDYSYGVLNLVNLFKRYEELKHEAPEHPMKKKVVEDLFYTLSGNVLTFTNIKILRDIEIFRKQDDRNLSKAFFPSDLPEEILKDYEHLLKENRQDLARDIQARTDLKPHPEVYTPLGASFLFGEPIMKHLVLFSMLHPGFENFTYEDLLRHDSSRDQRKTQWMTKLQEMIGLFNQRSSYADTAGVEKSFMSYDFSLAELFYGQTLRVLREEPDQNKITEIYRTFQENSTQNRLMSLIEPKSLQLALYHAENGKASLDHFFESLFQQAASKASLHPDDYNAFDELLTEIRGRLLASETRKYTPKILAVQARRDFIYKTLNQAKKPLRKKELLARVRKNKAYKDFSFRNLEKDIDKDLGTKKRGKIKDHPNFFLHHDEVETRREVLYKILNQAKRKITIEELWKRLKRNSIYRKVPRKKIVGDVHYDLGNENRERLFDHPNISIRSKEAEVRRRAIHGVLQRARKPLGRAEILSRVKKVKGFENVSYETLRNDFEQDRGYLKRPALKDHPRLFIKREGPRRTKYSSSKPIFSNALQEDRVPMRSETRNGGDSQELVRVGGVDGGEITTERVEIVKPRKKTDEEAYEIIKRNYGVFLEFEKHKKRLQLKITEMRQAIEANTRQQKIRFGLLFLGVAILFRIWSDPHYWVDSLLTLGVGLGFYAVWGNFQELKRVKKILLSEKKEVYKEIDDLFNQENLVKIPNEYEMQKVYLPPFSMQTSSSNLKKFHPREILRVVVPLNDEGVIEEGHHRVEYSFSRFSVDQEPDLFMLGQTHVYSQFSSGHEEKRFSEFAVGPWSSIVSKREKGHIYGPTESTPVLKIIPAKGGGIYLENLTEQPAFVEVLIPRLAIQQPSSIDSITGVKSQADLKVLETNFTKKSGDWVNKRLRNVVIGIGVLGIFLLRNSFEGIFWGGIVLVGFLAVRFFVRFKIGVGLGSEVRKSQTQGESKSETRTIKPEEKSRRSFLQQTVMGGAAFASGMFLSKELLAAEADGRFGLFMQPHGTHEEFERFADDLERYLVEQAKSGQAVLFLESVPEPTSYLEVVFDALNESGKDKLFEVPLRTTMDLQVALFSDKGRVVFQKNKNYFNDLFIKIQKLSNQIQFLDTHSSDVSFGKALGEFMRRPRIQSLLNSKKVRVVFEEYPDFLDWYDGEMATRLFENSEESLWERIIQRQDPKEIISYTEQIGDFYVESMYRRETNFIDLIKKETRQGRDAVAVVRGAFHGPLLIQNLQKSFPEAAIFEKVEGLKADEPLKQKYLEKFIRFHQAPPYFELRIHREPFEGEVSKEMKHYYAGLQTLWVILEKIFLVDLAVLREEFDGVFLKNRILMELSRKWVRGFKEISFEEAVPMFYELLENIANLRRMAQSSPLREGEENIHAIYIAMMTSELFNKEDLQRDFEKVLGRKLNAKILKNIPLLKDGNASALITQKSTKNFKQKRKKALQREKGIPWAEIGFGLTATTLAVAGSWYWLKRQKNRKDIKTDHSSSQRKSELTQKKSPTAHKLQKKKKKKRKGGKKKGGSSKSETRQSPVVVIESRKTSEFEQFWKANVESNKFLAPLIAKDSLEVEPDDLVQEKQGGAFQIITKRIIRGVFYQLITSNEGVIDNSIVVRAATKIAKLRKLLEEKYGLIGVAQRMPAVLEVGKNGEVGEEVLWAAYQGLDGARDLRSSLWEGLNTAQKLEHLIKVAEFFAAMHELGWVHNLIRAENTWMNASKEVMVINFFQAEESANTLKDIQDFGVMLEELLLEENIEGSGLEPLISQLKRGELSMEEAIDELIEVKDFFVSSPESHAREIKVQLAGKYSFALKRLEVLAGERVRSSNVISAINVDIDIKISKIVGENRIRDQVHMKRVLEAYSETRMIQMSLEDVVKRAVALLNPTLKQRIHKLEQLDEKQTFIRVRDVVEDKPHQIRKPQARIAFAVYQFLSRILGELREGSLAEIAVGHRRGKGIFQITIPYPNAMTNYDSEELVRFKGLLKEAGASVHLNAYPEDNPTQTRLTFNFSYAPEVKSEVRFKPLKPIKSLTWHNEADVLGHFKALMAELGWPLPRQVRVESAVGKLPKATSMTVSKLQELADGKSFEEYYRALRSEQINFLPEFGSPYKEAFFEKFGILDKWAVAFRYEEQLQSIRHFVESLPSDRKEPVRIQVHATWNGEDAYAIAVMLDHLFPNRKFEIVGSDFSSVPNPEEMNWVAIKRIPNFLKGALRKYFIQKTEYVVAFNPEALSDRIRISFKEGDLLDSSSFEQELDVVVANAVLGQSVYHKESIAQSLKNAWNALKEGGRLYVDNHAYQKHPEQKEVVEKILAEEFGEKFFLISEGIYLKINDQSDLKKAKRVKHREALVEVNEAMRSAALYLLDEMTHLDPELDVFLEKRPESQRVDIFIKHERHSNQRIGFRLMWDAKENGAVGEPIFRLWVFKEPLPWVPSREGRTYRTYQSSEFINLAKEALSDEKNGNHWWKDLLNPPNLSETRTLILNGNKSEKDKAFEQFLTRLGFMPYTNFQNKIYGEGVRIVVSQLRENLLQPKNQGFVPYFSDFLSIYFSQDRSSGVVRPATDEEILNWSLQDPVRALAHISQEILQDARIYEINQRFRSRRLFHERAGQTLSALSWVAKFSQPLPASPHLGSVLTSGNFTFRTPEGRHARDKAIKELIVAKRLVQTHGDIYGGLNGSKGAEFWSKAVKSPLQPSATERGLVQDVRRQHPKDWYSTVFTENVFGFLPDVEYEAVLAEVMGRIRRERPNSMKVIRAMKHSADAGISRSRDLAPPKISLTRWEKSFKKALLGIRRKGSIGLSASETSAQEGYSDDDKSVDQFLDRLEQPESFVMSNLLAVADKDIADSFFATHEVALRNSKESLTQYSMEAAKRVFEKHFGFEFASTKAQQVILSKGFNVLNKRQEDPLAMIRKSLSRSYPNNFESYSEKDWQTKMESLTEHHFFWLLKNEFDRLVRDNPDVAGKRVETAYRLVGDPKSILYQRAFSSLEPFLHQVEELERKQEQSVALQMVSSLANSSTKITNYAGSKHLLGRNEMVHPLTSTGTSLTLGESFSETRNAFLGTRSLDLVPPRSEFRFSALEIPFTVDLTKVRREFWSSISALGMVNPDWNSRQENDYRLALRKVVGAPEEEFVVAEQILPNFSIIETRRENARTEPVRVVRIYEKLPVLESTEIQVLVDFLAKNKQAYLFIEAENSDEAERSQFRKGFMRAVRKGREENGVASRGVNLKVVSNSSEYIDELKDLNYTRALVYGNERKKLEDLQNQVLIKGEKQTSFIENDLAITADPLEEASALLTALDKLFSPEPLSKVVVSVVSLLAQNTELKIQIQTLLAKSA